MSSDHRKEALVEDVNTEAPLLTTVGGLGSSRSESHLVWLTAAALARFATALLLLLLLLWVQTTCLPSKQCLSRPRCAARWQRAAAGPRSGRPGLARAIPAKDERPLVSVSKSACVRGSLRLSDQRPVQPLGAILSSAASSTSGRDLGGSIEHACALHGR